ncbi:hypothetical protein ACHAWF_005941 [Thalassiosira exigua]
MSGNANNAANDPGAESIINQRWWCYLLIGITSLTNFVSVGQTFHEDFPKNYYVGNKRLAYAYGVVTFAASLLVLVSDLLGFIRKKFDLMSMMDGKVEGGTLTFFVLWWVVGVVSITHSGAIGYASLNIYLSAWATLFACVDALNRWMGEKDILTLQELTRLSVTLPYWWIVFWASVVITGSAIDASHLTPDDYVKSSCSVAVGIGCLTALFSAFFVLSHYEFLTCCRACATWLSYGGWFELLCSVFVNLVLVIGLEQLTGAGRIASTVTGNVGVDPAAANYVPGTNIYFATWSGFVASVMVTAKWKEARAIRFAQTSAEKGDEDGGEGLPGDEEEGGTEAASDER